MIDETKGTSIGVTLFITQFAEGLKGTDLEHVTGNAFAYFDERYKAHIN